MKKLNRKGFTLIELLAVIVILAVVMVVTIPSVLKAMATAREKQAMNAIATIVDYVQKNYELCTVSAELGTSQYDTSLFTTSTDCSTLITAKGNQVVKAAGYNTSDIKDVTGSLTDGKYKITAATIMKTGKFSDVGTSAGKTLSDGVKYTLVAS